MPRPIKTAPKDGTPILTDCGLCRYLCSDSFYFVLCTPDGSPIEYGDDYNDDRMFYVFPTLWEPLPDWMKG